ncbi:MAG: DUF4126 family protein [Proteobacteria bacterium]|nr:DUF4126 family protein [Pseudomonadota bacterium]
MLKSLLMGLVGGQRSMTPLAVVSVAAARGRLPARDGATGILGHPAVVAAALALAAGELAGDKMKSAPDRIIPIGLAARAVTSGIAGAALAPSDRRWLGAAVGSATAVAASFIGWRARAASMPRYGQTRTGLIEDAIVIASAIAIMRGSNSTR